MQLRASAPHVGDPRFELRLRPVRDVVHLDLVLVQEIDDVAPGRRLTLAIGEPAYRLEKECARQKEGDADQAGDMVCHHKAEGDHRDQQ